MSISKDLQEILEGAHYFLTETLCHEALTGKVECVRRGLVLQLEALAVSYPTLKIRRSSSVSLPYLSMNQGSTPITHRLSKSLSSTSNSNSNSYYSNSSSGGEDHQQFRDTDNHSTQDEEYEDFQDSKGTEDHDSNDIAEELDVTHDDLDDNEDALMETCDVVAFSTIIATCDKHGVLTKKTKGLLRNMKNYHCVAANRMLYLYLKESDRRQRKTIDLTGYMARLATGEDIRDKRKRDAAFEIVGPGKKTHMFIARTARDRTEWLAALGRTIRGCRSSTLPSMSSLSGFFEDLSSNDNAFIIPPKVPPNATTITKDDFYYHDVNDDVKEEVYEVIGPEGTVFGKPVGTNESLPSSQPHGQFLDQQDYDTVSPEEIPPPLPQFPPPSTPNFGKRAPERPPLPTNIQNRINKQAARPLPDAPNDTNYNSYDPGLYSEIEEDLLGTESETFESSGNEYKNFSGNTNYVNRNHLDQDTKKPRAVSADGLPHDLSNRTSTNSLVGSFSDEILMNMNISDPNISQLTPSKYTRCSTIHRTPPKLPPKGVPLTLLDDDDNEYKVPSSAIMDVEYQIPGTPIPTEAETEKTIRDISGPIHPASETYQVPTSQTVVPIKPQNSRRNSFIEEHPKTLSSFLNEKEERQSKNPLTSSTKQLERKESSSSRDFRDSKLSNQGTSVKDMIARLNKNKSVAENSSTTKAKETSAIIENTSSDQCIKKSAIKIGSSEKTNLSEVEMTKPNLPPRPQNLLNKSAVTHKMALLLEENKKQSDIQTANESDDDYYETPEGNSFDSTSQKDVIDGSIALHTVKPESAQESPVAICEGEWYTAKFAFVATIDEALSFNRGERILVHKTPDHSGWWRATVKGRSGVVPREYLMKVS